jgi:hypothetical protein
MASRAKPVPFTRALLSNIAQPGVEIRHALTKVRAQVSKETNRAQLPWENTNLTGFFYVNQQGAATTASIGAPGAPSEARSNASNEIELEFWRSVRTGDRAEEYSAYLARFPHGNFVSIARLRLAALQTAGRTNVQSFNPALPRARPRSSSGSINLNAAIFRGDCRCWVTSTGPRMATSTTTRAAQLSVGKPHGATSRAAISANCSMRRGLQSAIPSDRRRQPLHDNSLRRRN